MHEAEKLSELFTAKHACVRIVTSEEPEAIDFVRDAAAGLRLPVHTWSIIQGVRDTLVADAPPAEGTENAGAAMVWWRHVIGMGNPAVCVMLDLADSLENPSSDPPRVLRAFRELVEHFRALNAAPVQVAIGEAPPLGPRACLVLIDNRATCPEIVTRLATPMELSPPDDEELGEIFKATLRRLHRERPIQINLSKAQHSTVVKNLRGLSRRQAAQLVCDAVATDRVLDADDVHNILAGKRRLLASEGTLEFVETPNSLESIGGLARLKKWLSERERAFSPEAARFGLSAPRGVLMLGVQGAGKSLCAKAIAAAWKRPLFRMDPGALYDRYVGESERRLRDTLRQAEAMAPVVLWIDEIEKAFASAAAQSTDGGLSKRMFGTLLTWMQEHSSPVFLVATANDIEALPPELLRKGRFDEIFFVDLPGMEARREIIGIHLKKRSRDPAKFDLPVLVAESRGFSGAEIEQGIVSALAGAFAQNAEPDTARVVRALRDSPPLSVTMAEKVQALREWAEGRCVQADDPECE
jgi:ATP-dependent 26S proteasome regulatory subunit